MSERLEQHAKTIEEIIHSYDKSIELCDLNCENVCDSCAGGIGEGDSPCPFRTIKWVREERLVDAQRQHDVLNAKLRSLRVDWRDKRELALKCMERITELEGRLQRIRELLKNRPSHKWMIRNLDKIEDVESFFRKLEKEVEK